MKVLVVNGSPRGPQGNTAVLTDAFVSGAVEAGASVETVYLRDKKINHCIGCFTCWTKTPGVCVHKDDMPEIFAKGWDADVIVYASPLYIYTVTGMMKDFMDRMLPIAQPFIDVENGVSTHPARHGDMSEKMAVLISNCGFPEPDHFSGLKETFRCWFRGNKRSLAGMICCAGGPMLTSGLDEGVAWYLDAVRQAGREVVTSRHISDQTQAALDRPLMEDQEAYAEMANAHWQSLGLTRIGEGSQPRDKPCEVSAEPLPSPTSMDTMRDLVAGMALSLDSAEAGDLRAIVQFAVTDEDPGRYFLDIENGRCAAYAGEHPNPTATITTPSKVWLAIARGEMNGATAFLTAKYRVSGDLSLLMRFDKLFIAARG